MIFRVVNAVLVLSFLGVCALIVLNGANNPVEARRMALSEQLPGLMEDTAPMQAVADADNASFQKSVIDGSRLWRELIAPKQQVEQPPDLKVILQGVVPTRVQVGGRIRIATPTSPRGDMYGVGDTINGARINVITSEFVEFAYPWKGRDLTLRIARN